MKPRTFLKSKTRAKRPKKRVKKLTLKRAAQTLGRFIYRHLVQLPEQERERNIAAVERAIKKKFGRQKRKKRLKQS